MGGGEGGREEKMGGGEGEREERRGGGEGDTGVSLGKVLGSSKLRGVLSASLPPTLTTTLTTTPTITPTDYHYWDSIGNSVDFVTTQNLQVTAYKAIRIKSFLQHHPTTSPYTIISWPAPKPLLFSQPGPKAIASIAKEVLLLILTTYIIPFN